jgi:hypothetical protein
MNVTRSYKTLHYKRNNYDIQGFHRFVTSLVSRFEDFKPANQRNIPEDHLLSNYHIYRLHVSARLGHHQAFIFILSCVKIKIKA